MVRLSTIAVSGFRAQDKSSSLGVHVMRMLMNDGDDVLHVNVGSWVATSHVASQWERWLRHNHRTPGKSGQLQRYFDLRVRRAVRSTATPDRPQPRTIRLPLYLLQWRRPIWSRKGARDVHVEEEVSKKLKFVVN